MATDFVRVKFKDGSEASVPAAYAELPEVADNISSVDKEDTTPHAASYDKLTAAAKKRVEAGEKEVS